MTRKEFIRGGLVDIAFGALVFFLVRHYAGVGWYAASFAAGFMAWWSFVLGLVDTDRPGFVLMMWLTLGLFAAAGVVALLYVTGASVTIGAH